MLDNRNVMYNGREWKVRVTFDNGQIFDGATIIDFTTTATQDTNSIIGATQGKQIELNLLASSNTNLNGLFKVEVGEYYFDKIDNKYKTHWFNLGEHWKVESIEQRDSQSVAIVGVDPMVYLFGDDVYREGGNSTNITTSDLIAHIQTKYGITIEGNIPEVTIINPYLEKYRDILCYLGIISSSNCFFKADSMTVKYVPLIPKEVPDLAIDGQFYYNITYDRSEFEVKKVALDTGDGFGYSRGEGSVDETITLKMPFATQEICDLIYDNLLNYTQEGIDCKFLAHPSLEPFDTLQLTDIYGAVHLTQINGYKLVFNGGLNMELATQIMSPSNTTTNYVEEKLRTKIKVEADRILSVVEAEYAKKESSLTVQSSKENISITLDEDMTPSKTEAINIEFKVLKNQTTEKVPCVIKSVQLSDDNITAQYSNTSNILTIKANTDKVFTNMEGYIDVVIETTLGDVYKRLFWDATINTIENPLLVLSAPTQTFTRANKLANFTPSTITITASTVRCDVKAWKYSTDNGSTFTGAVSGSNGLTISNNKLTIANNSTLFNSTKNVIIKAESDEVSDTITINQVEDADMIYIMLSNENHTFPATSDGKAVPDSTTIEVYGFKGIDEAQVTIGSINGLPTGMTATINGNIINITVTNKMNTLSGSLNIPITCEGISFTKKFSYSLAVSGGKGILEVVEYYLASNKKSSVTVDDGFDTIVPELTIDFPYLWNYEVIRYTDGTEDATEPALIGTYSEDGKGIDSIAEYYLISSKSTGITTSSSGWSTTIPTLTAENKYLWNYEEIVYTDGTSDTTDPVVIGVYGDKGENASWVKIETTSQVFKLIGTSYSPSTITLSPTFNNSTYSKWQYSTNNGSTWTNVTSGSNGLTISNNKLIIANTCSLFTDSINVIQFRVTGTNNAVDIMSIMRIQDGTDAFSVILDNEAHTFSANYEGYAMAQEITLGLLGYIGDDACNLTVGTISGLPNGMTVKINNNGSATPSIKITVSANVMNTRNGVLNIPVSTTYNGKSYSCNKKFSYSLSLDGTPASSCKINAPASVFLSDDGGKTYSPTTITFTGTFTECVFSKWQYLDVNTGSFKNVVTGEHGFTLSGNNLILAVTSDLFNEKGGTISIRLLSDKDGVYDTLTISKLVQIKDLAEDIENIRSEIEQTNHNWKASFSTANATNILFDGDFDKEISKCNWAKLNGSSIEPYYSTINAYPFYENHNGLNTAFNYNTLSGVVYSLDLTLKPDTDYVYQAYVYTNNADIINTSSTSPLQYWCWTDETPKNDNSNTSEVIDYSQILYTSRYNLCYVHFKTKAIEGQTIKCRLFISGQSTSSGNQAMVGIREVCFRERDTVAPYTGNSNEIIAGVTTIDMNGITVEHTLSKTKTEMSADGFRIMDTENEDEVISEWSSKEYWTEFKTDKIFANNIENIYTGESNLYVDHSATVAGDGTSSKPFNSFAQLSNHLMANPVINKDIYVVVRDPGFAINEQLYLERLKGTGFIKITLEGTLVINNAGSGQYCIRLHQIPKWVWLVSGREFGSNVTGAVLGDGGDGNGHGIFATDVDRLEVDSLTIACKNWGIRTERTHLYTRHIDFGKCYCAVELNSMSIYYSSDDVGSCVDFCRLLSGSFAYWGCGTVRPQGNVQWSDGMHYDGGVSLTPTGSPRFGSVDPTPPPTSGQIFTYTYDCTSKQSYQYSWSNWSTDGSAKQGAWGYGLRGGHLFFDMTKIRSEMTGTIQDGNTITLTRANSGGISGDANVYINGSSCSSASGTPSYSNQTHLGTLKWGETKTFTLPKEIVQNLVNGTCSSLAVYVNSTASNNYINITSASITLKTKK